MLTAAIIQARMGSHRLPGKVLMPLAGKPVLWHVINRLKYSQKINVIVVATTGEKIDDAVVKLCEDNGVPYFRGSEDDVLDRYYQAAKMFNADPIVRITADCPAIDPYVVDEVVEGFLNGNYDIYGLSGEFPDGLDCTVFSFRALEDAWRNAELPSEREHVCPYMEGHPEKFKIGGYEKFKGMGHYRWTLDTEDDYKFLSEVFSRLYKENELFLTEDIVRLMEREPDLMQLNSHVQRNEGYIKSLDNDKKFLNPAHKEKRGF
jgi:spore coat polysaccharide biosynthesis protein SpsF